MKYFKSRSVDMRFAVDVWRYGVSLGRVAVGFEGVAATGVPGVVSVRVDMGVVCLLEDLRSRALALPVPFLDAGAIFDRSRALAAQTVGGSWWPRFIEAASPGAIAGAFALVKRRGRGRIEELWRAIPVSRECRVSLGRVRESAIALMA